MAGTIAADTLTHSTAGSVDTQYVVDGTAKSYHNFVGTGTAATNDSLNISTLTDNGTGDYTSTFVSSFDNAFYVFGGGTMETGSTGTNESTVGAHRNTSYSTSVTTSSFTMQVTTSSGSLADRTVFISYTGELT